MKSFVMCNRAFRLLGLVLVGVLLSGRSVAQDNQSILETITGLNDRAEALIRVKPDSAFRLAAEALELSKAHDLELEEGRSQHISGMVLLHRGVYAQALNHLLAAQAHFRQAGNAEAYLAAGHNQLGLLYGNIRQKEMARQSHGRALHLYQQQRDTLGLASTYGCLGQLFESYKQYDSALYCQEIALQYYQRLNDQQGQVIILTNLGTVYEHQQVYDKALMYYQQSLDKNTIIRDSLSIIRNINNIGDIYRAQGNYQASLTLTYQALDIATRLFEQDEIWRAYKDLARTYAAMNDFEKAFACAQKYHALYEESFSAAAEEQSKLFETLFEIDEKVDQISRLESKRQMDSVIKGSLGVVLALLGLLAWVVINRQQLKLKKEREDMIRNNAFHEAQQKIIRIELENTHLREKQLQQELQQKAKSLATQTLQMTGQSKVMEVVQEQLTGLMHEQPAAQRKKVKHLIKRIDHHTLTSDTDWNSFRQTFENIHDNFLEKLTKTYPDLTPAEIRLASLFRLNLSSQAMAETLGISQDSLRIARYRLKKKLALTENQTLQSFILSL